MLFVGIDWASDHHDISALAPDGHELLKARVPHTGEGFESLAAKLAELGVAAPEIAVAVEMHEGPLVIWLLDQGYQVYGINPRTAGHARDRLSASGAKDDKRDALSLADFLRTSLPRLRPLCSQDPTTAQMRHYVGLREDLVQERTSHKQILSGHLMQYAPELEQLLSPFRGRWTQELLIKFPTMKRIRAAKRSRIRAAVGKGRISSEKMEALMKILKTRPIPVPDYLDAAHALEVQYRVRAIQHLDEAVAEVDKRLRELISSHPDSNIVESLPVQGAATIGGLLSGLKEGMQMYRNANELAAYWGAAPVTIQSGKNRNVRKRQACNQTQRQSLLWFSFMTSHKDDCWAHEYYQRKRSEGCKHYTALRCVGRRWVRILWALFSQKKTYDESVVRRMAHAPSPA